VRAYVYLCNGWPVPSFTPVIVSATIYDHRQTECKPESTNPRTRAIHISLRGIVSRYQFPFPPNFGFRPLTLTDESHFGPTWMRPQCELEK